MPGFKSTPNASSRRVKNERGNHAALYARSGRYREMYDAQHGVESDLFLAPGEGAEPPAAPPSTEPGPGRADAPPRLPDLGMVEP